MFLRRSSTFSGLSVQVHSRILLPAAIGPITRAALRALPKKCIPLADTGEPASLRNSSSFSSCGGVGNSFGTRNGFLGLAVI